MPKTYTIAWHEECLQNSTQYHARELALVQRRLAELEALKKTNEKYARQIQRA